MASPVEAQIILCDAAVADPSGKIHMLGAGWSVTSSPTAPSAVAVLLKIPWDRANVQIPLELVLLDSDGRPAEVPSDAGPAQVRHAGQVEVGRPAGLAHGSMIDAAFALSIPPLPILAGRYQWRLDVGGTVESAFFEVRISPGG